MRQIVHGFPFHLPHRSAPEGQNGRLTVQDAAIQAGSGSSKFTDLSPLVAAPSAAASATNYLDAGTLSNGPSRYYQIRLGP